MDLAEAGAAMLREGRLAVWNLLPPENRAAMKARRKAKNERARSKYRAKLTRNAEQTKRVFELYCTGHIGDEVARALQISATTVSHTIQQFWPFPRAGRDNRYIIMRLSPKQLQALDALAADLCLTRSRALEEIGAFALEEDAAIARRTLRVPRRTAA